MRRSTQQLEYAKGLTDPRIQQLFLRQIGTRKMNNIDLIIDQATLPKPLKTQLKRLSRTLLTCREEEKALTEECQKASTLSMVQFSEDLRHASTDDERNKIMLNHVGCREWLNNTVLRQYENNRHIRDLSNRLLKKLNALVTGEDAATRSANEALKALAELGASDDRTILAQLENIPDLSRERLEDTERMLFKQRLTGQGPYARVNFTAQPINVFKPSAEQAELVAATARAIDSFNKYRPNGAAYVLSKKALDRSSFAEQMKSALEAGDMAAFERIKRDIKAAEAAVFVNAIRLQAAVELFRAETARFARVITKAAQATRDDQSLTGLIAMSNCMGAWHWHYEMEHLLRAYESYKVPETLKDPYCPLTFPVTI